VIGLGTRISALLLAATMAVAFVTAIVPHSESFLDLFSTIELTYLAIFAWLIVSGPGPISIDHLLARRGQAGPHVGEPA
jgi:putative oxidoreductase